jgi:rod shape-determining protein MreD
MPYRLPLLAVFLACSAVQIALSRLRFYEADMLMIFLVYAGLTRGAPKAIFSAAAAGLVEDTLSGGFFGFYGFSKTVVGYLTNIAGRYLVADAPAVQGAVLTLSVCVEAAVLHALRALFTHGEPPAVQETLLRAAGTLVLGLLTLRGIQRAERALERRRYGR